MAGENWRVAKTGGELQREAEQSEVKRCGSLQPEKPRFSPMNALWASPSLAAVPAPWASTDGGLCDSCPPLGVP